MYVLYPGSSSLFSARTGRCELRRSQCYTTSMRPILIAHSASSSPVCLVHFLVYLRYTHTYCFHYLSVIQGEADVSAGLTESDLQGAIDFCLAVFAPTSPELHVEVAERLDNKELMERKAPPMLPKDVVSVLGHDADAVHVVQKINARKLTHVQVDDVKRHFVQETFEGLVPSIQRGRLGLRPVPA